MQFKKADVEPGAEACFQLTVERTQRRVLVEVAQQVGAQIDENLTPCGMALNWVRMRRRAERIAPQCRFGRPLPIAADCRLILGMCLSTAFGSDRTRWRRCAEAARPSSPRFR